MKPLDTFLHGATKSILAKKIFSPLREFRKFIDGVLVTHGLVALGANWSKVVEVRRPAFAVRHVVTHLEVKGSQGVFAPLDETLLLKVLVTKVQNPNLFTECHRNLSSCHIF